MSAHAYQVGDDPVFFPVLEGLEAEGQQLGTAKSAANTNAPHPFHAANAPQFGTQETGTGSLVRHAPNRGEPEVDGGRPHRRCSR